MERPVLRGGPPLPRNALALALGLVLALAGVACGRFDTLSTTGASRVGAQRAATDDAVAALADAAKGYVLGCGPTRRAPAGVAAAGEDTFACAVIDRDTRTKSDDGPWLTSLEVTLIDGSTASPALVPIDPVDAMWHDFFALPSGRFERIRKLRATAELRGHRVVLSNDGLAVHDPEHLTDLDERLNTFSVPDPDGDVVLERVAGHVIFVTQSDYAPGVDFKSLADADALCASEAKASSRLAIYSFVALMSDEAIDARDRVALSGPVYNVRLKPLVDDAAALFTASSFAAPLRVARGDLATNALRVWTGSREDGTRAAGETCASWTTSDAAQAAVAGNPSAVPSWVEAERIECSGKRRLYCLSRP